MAEVIIPGFSISIGIGIGATCARFSKLETRATLNVGFNVSVAAESYRPNALLMSSLSNDSALGTLLVFTPFLIQPYHARVFKTYLGDWYIGDRVTGLNGESGEGGQTFQLTLIGALDLIDELTSRVETQSVRVNVAWLDTRTGETVSESVMLEGDVTSLPMTVGGRSRSIVLYCKGRAQARQYTGVVHKAFGVEYSAIAEGSRSIRMPIQMDYKIGDRLAFELGEFDIKNINYTITPTEAVMSVSG